MLHSEIMGNTAKHREAIDLALKGEWDGAHRIVQDLEDETASWIHAVLHKIEGDLGNSKYWYARARRPFTEEDSIAELESIRQSLR